MAVSPPPAPSSIDLSGLPPRVVEAAGRVLALCREELRSEPRPEAPEEVELRVREATNEFARDVMGAVIENRDDGASRIERDGQSWFRVAVTPKTIMTSLGPVTYRFSASTISTIVKRLDAQLLAFARRRLDEPFPYVIVDARYEKVRDNGVIASQAVLIALGIDGEGRRQVLAVELANRESTSSWKGFLLSLKERGLSGVEFVVSDDHPGLKKAIAEVLPEAAWQRCYVHFLRNALDHMPRKRDDDCLQELRWLYDRRDIGEARRDLAAWLTRWQGKYPTLTDWVEDNIEETLAFYRLPRQHHKHLKSTNMLERYNQEIKRRTHIVRVFPNGESCLRLIRALAVETHEDWLEANRYINMKLLTEHKRELMKQAA